MLKAITKLGPKHHGMAVPLEEFESADYQLGFNYELINGRVYVCPKAAPSHDFLATWINDVLTEYKNRRPAVVNYVTTGARVFVPGDDDSTVPEPDVAAYQSFPRDSSLPEVRWEDVSPILVGEVVSSDDPAKDLIRNVALYIQVPSIREYWILDGRADWNEPTLLVYRRRGRRWQDPIEVGFRDVYTTRLLPGLSLVVDPRS